MGIWSIEGFASDDALDWLAELPPGEGAAGVRRTLRRIAGSGDAHLSLADAERALAAAELAAALCGHPHPALPGTARRWLEAHREPPVPPEERLAMLVDATFALDLVVTSSALAELWSQRAEEPLWRAALDDLRMRLAAAGGAEPATPLA